MKLSPLQRHGWWVAVAVAAAVFTGPPESAQAQSSTPTRATSPPSGLSAPLSLGSTLSRPASAAPRSSALTRAVPTVAVVPRRQADERSRTRPVQVSGAIGWATFTDENFIDHVTVTGSVRVPFSQAWSVEPRFIYMRSGAADQDFYAMASLIYDLQTRGRVTPYWTIGGGYFWHRSTFPAFAGFEERTFVSGEPHLSGGFGARIRLAERWSVVSEVRLGWEPILQCNAGIGYSF